MTLEDALDDAKTYIAARSDGLTVRQVVRETRSYLLGKGYPVKLASLASKFSFDCLAVNGSILVFHSGKIICVPGRRFS